MSEKNIFISFDVDGTTVLFDHCVAGSYEAFGLSMKEQFGDIGDPTHFLDPVNIAGWMDSKTLAHYIEKLGFEPNEENVQKAVKRAEDYFIDIFKVKPTVPKGMEQALKELSKNPNVTIGLASGNCRRIAWTKLTNAGIADLFEGRIGGFGSDVRERVDAIKASKAMAEKLTGKEFQKWIHVGDMPTDAEAAIAAGAQAVIVKTGGIEFSDNEYPKPCTIFQNLEEAHDKFMKLVFD